MREAFPGKKLLRRTRPVRGPTQTQLFGNGISQLGEVDLLLLPWRCMIALPEVEPRQVNMATTDAAGRLQTLSDRRRGE